MRLIRDLRENEVKKEQADGDDGEECPGDDALAVAAAKGIAFFEKERPEPDPRGQAGKAEDGVSVAAGEAEYRAPRASEEHQCAHGGYHAEDKTDDGCGTPARFEFPRGDGGGQRADPQQIVPAPVSGAVLFHRPLFVRSGRLAETGQRVKFSQKSDHRPALAIGPGKGGGDTGQIPLHLKALLLQRLAIELSGIALVEPGLRVVPQRVAHGPKQRLFFLNALQRPLLFCRHLLVLLPTAPVSELLEIKYIITDMFRKLWCNYTISMPRLSIEKDSIF